MSGTRQLGFRPSSLTLEPISFPLFEYHVVMPSGTDYSSVVGLKAVGEQMVFLSTGEHWHPIHAKLCPVLLASLTPNTFMLDDQAPQLWDARVLHTPYLSRTEGTRGGLPELLP